MERGNMMKRYLIAAILAVTVLSAVTYAYDENIYRTDFTVTDTDRTYSVTTGGIAIAVTDGIITVNDEPTVGMCGKTADWYITSQQSTGKFNVVLNGTSIFSGTAQITDGELVISDADDRKIHAEGIVPYEKAEIASDKYSIADGYITEIGENTTARELISNLKISGNGTAKILTKNGVVETECLNIGDYLICTDMLGNSEKFTFPETDLGNLYSDFFKLDLTTMTVANLPGGLTNAQLKGAIKSDKDFDVEQQNGNLKITVQGNDYEFKSVVQPPESARIYHNKCDNNDFLNYSVSAANVKETYTDKNHGNSLETAPEQTSSNATLKHEINHDGGVIVVSNDIKYNFETPDNHTRQFNAPVIVGTSGDTFYVRERRGELVYRNPDDDYSLNISSENDTWHNIGMIVCPDEKTYSVYYDGVKKADATLAATFDKIKYLSYTTNAIDKAEDGKMYVDNIEIFKPFVQLGTIEYLNENTASYNSENINGITALKLVFSDTPYNKINQSTVADKITLAYDGKPVKFTAQTTENTVLLTLDEPLKNGEYKLSITEPETIYGKDNSTYEYTFATGAKIKYVSAETDGKIVYAETKLSDTDEFKDCNILLGVYDTDMRLCGSTTVKADNVSDHVFLKCNVENAVPHYVKVFAWNDLNGIQPICGAYVKNLAEEAER